MVTFLGGAAIGALAIASGGVQYFYQFFMPETVYLACTGHVGHPGELTGSLLEFLTSQSRSFDCANLPDDVSSGRIGIFAQTHLYLMLSIGWLWSLTSPNYQALWPLAGIVYGAYVCGIFAVLRLFFPRSSALAGTIVLALSASAIGILPWFRDFSKAPFIIWGLVLLIMAARAVRMKRQLTLAALAGLVAGIGYGFRTDVAIVAPLALIFLVAGIGPRQYLNRAVATAAFIACFVLSSWPVLSVGNTSALGAMTMEGAADPFNNYLGLTAAPYSWGTRYSDELTLSSIAADMRPLLPNWDANEGKRVYGTSQAITRSTSYLLSRGNLIVGDLATRALKSAGWILAYPSAVTLDRRARDPGIFIPDSLLNLPYGILGQLWTVPLGLLGFAAFMLREMALRPRESVALLFGLGLLLGYTALQFSMRHMFHLEFFWMLGALGLFHAIKEAKSLFAVLPRFIIALIIVAGATGSIYASLLTYQDQSMVATVEDLLAGPREPIIMAPFIEEATTTFVIQLPDNHRAITEGAPDSMVGKALPISQQWSAVAEVDRLLLTLGGKNCSAEDVAIIFNYDKRDAWQPFDEVRNVKLGPRGSTTSIILPAFYRATQNFSSISIPTENAPCVVAIERLLAPTRLPAVLSVTLSPGWEKRPMHLGLF